VLPSFLKSTHSLKQGLGTMSLVHVRPFPFPRSGPQEDGPKLLHFCCDTQTPSGRSAGFGPIGLIDEDWLQLIFVGSKVLR
jgi:hypothetical protein